MILQNMIYSPLQLLVPQQRAGEPCVELLGFTATLITWQLEHLVPGRRGRVLGTAPLGVTRDLLTGGPCWGSGFWLGEDRDG